MPSPSSLDFLSARFVFWCCKEALTASHSSSSSLSSSCLVSATSSPYFALRIHSLDCMYRCCLSLNSIRFSCAMEAIRRPILKGRPAVNLLLAMMSKRSLLEARPLFAIAHAFVIHLMRASGLQASATFRSTSTSSVSTFLTAGGRLRSTTSAGRELFKGFASAMHTVILSSEENFERQHTGISRLHSRRAVPAEICCENLQQEQPAHFC
mmetsp:Transcript_148117/g.261190  ORF Transcript_148117/g.261190 Transcript_148117/m.261190 type:complete len:210 (-) Transcript_148117:17-646(-)